MNTDFPDSLIFDMDGTLWDAVDSYCRVWNETFATLGMDCKPIGRDALLGLMGMPIEEIVRRVAPDALPRMDEFMETLAEKERTMMPVIGGRLYDGVAETLRALRRGGTRLFMVSNCSASGLDNFLDFTRLRHLFEGWLSYGETGQDKDANIRAIVERYNLKHPLYVGDIQRDADSAHAAGTGFVWAAYGFGKVADAEYTIHSFPELIKIVNQNGKRT